MERLERQTFEPVQEVVVEKAQATLQKFTSSARGRFEHVLWQKGILLAIVAFLLGRALILESVMPFAIPFFASVLVMKKERLPLAMLALLAGSLTINWTSTVFLLAAFFVFLFFYQVGRRFFKEEVKRLPFFVFFADAVTKTGFIWFTKETISLYDGAMIGVEAGLGFILTLIFLQSVPLLTIRKRRQALKTEEVISIIIMLASILTGTIGWVVYDVAVEHVLSRYLVLLFALSAGGTIGSTVGVVTGLILSLANIASLSQMSLLAFSGLLGGLLKEGKKLGVSIGLFIGTLLIGLYGEGTAQIVNTVLETSAAIVLFLLTPQSFIFHIAKYIPGTVEYTTEQQQYLRKIRDVTSHRVEQFSGVFQALSQSFSQFSQTGEDWKEDREIDYFLGNVTEKTCQNCFKKEQCWSQNFEATYGYMKSMMEEMDQSASLTNIKLIRSWEKHCSKPKKVIEVIGQEVTFYQAHRKLKKQVMESRRLVSEQLQGVSQVMHDFAEEIQREQRNHYIQEAQIIDALESYGLDIQNIDIYSLEKGNIDIEMIVPKSYSSGECEKLIGPMLSDLLGETILVKNIEVSPYPTGTCHVSFASSRAFMIETGIAHAAKGGGLVSGDSYATMELGVGKYAVAISDGMGNGERAHYESSETLKLLQKILQSGIEEKVAIKSINSILTLRTTDEIFSTLDLAVIDMQKATAKFLKIGSSPSYIKRGDGILPVSASNLPMGIIQDFEVDVVSEQLKAGDLLIMMSDGIYEGPKHVENQDAWMKRKIKELKTSDPQEVADILMEEVIRTRAGAIEDDMTVVVARIDHNTPKWAAIPAYQFIRKAQ